MSESSHSSKLIHAYERMMERVKTLLEEFEQAEQETLPNLQRSIERAAEIAVELGELTREEARLVGNYLKRDLQDAGHHLAETGHDLRAWLRFDLELIEERMLDFLRAAADKTRLEMLAFAESVERATHYYQGEITGPGTLQCEQCGELLAFHQTSLIPACPRCAAAAFSRVPGSAEEETGD
jgi:Zn finger protein HypA/HybF involved in hydrogenase expression